MKNLNLKSLQTINGGHCPPQEGRSWIYDLTYAAYVWYHGNGHKK